MLTYDKDSKIFHLPVQVTPFPAYPVLQLQAKLPSLLEQVATLSQPPLFVAHSLISTSTYKIALVLTQYYWKIIL